MSNSTQEDYFDDHILEVVYTPDLTPDVDTDALDHYNWQQEEEDQSEYDWTADEDIEQTNEERDILDERFDRALEFALQAKLDENVTKDVCLSEGLVEILQLLEPVQE